MDTTHILDLIAELQSVSPMPDDNSPIFDTEEGSQLLEKYASIIRSIGNEIDASSESNSEQSEIILPLLQALILSFGLGTGEGVFWGTLHLIEKIKATKRDDLLYEGLFSEIAGVRDWCCIILSRQRNYHNLPLFVEKLHDQEIEVKITALESIKMLAKVYSLTLLIPLLAQYVNEKNVRVKKAAISAQEAIRGFQSNGRV